MFFAFVLAIPHLIDHLEIVRHDKLPIAETLAENFFSFPAEQLLRRGRPAQHSKLVVPLDDREWCVLNVKSETPVFECGGFNELTFSHVANDRNTTDNFAFLVMTWRVVTFKKSAASRLSDGVGGGFP